MATALPQFPAFDISGPTIGLRWEKWLSRFKRLLIISKITEPTDKRAWLLHFVGESVNDIFDTIPDNGTDAEFDKAVDKLNDYFKPHVNREYEVFKFHQCEQRADESTDSYCTRLRELAASCQFPEVNREIKTQIITKGNSKKLRIRALSEEMTLEKLLRVGRSFELSKQQAEEIERAVSVNTSKSSKTSDTKEHNPVISYAGRSMNIRGKFSAEISGKNTTVSSTLYVTREGKGDLLSYETAVLLGYVPEICEVNEVGESIPEKTTDRYSKLCEEYRDIFEGIGKLKGVQVKLHIDETIQPMQNRHRRIPYHIREKVQEELEKLEQLDIIEEVVDVPTPWVSPIVAQPKLKKTNELRICVDMHEANRAIRRERHVTPTVDDVIFELPDVFHNAIQTTLQGIPKAFNISDDILVQGRTQGEHDDNLRQVFEQVRATNLALNREKCVFNQRHLSFFGHVWSPEGVSADPQKLEAIRKMKTPENAEEVRSLLGMAGYVSRSIPNFATITEPLKKLTRSKVTWEWGEEQGESLKKLYDLLQSQRVMAYYDPTKYTELIVDASPVGLGAILAQKESEEEEGGRIAAYASRALSEVEQRYSQTEREALAVAWETEKFHLYIYGKSVEIITDHKLLEGLFNNTRSKPNARIERWLMRMQDKYDYKVTYRPGKNPENPADYMSRYMVERTRPNAEDSRSAKEAEQYVNFIENHAIPKAVSAEEVKKATLEDNTLKKVIENLQKGRWNEHPRSVDTDTMKTFKKLRTELSVTRGGLLLKGTKMVVPTKLQERVVELAHQGHQGMVKTKCLIREKVWFPGIDVLVEKRVKKCMACQASTHLPESSKEPLKMSKLPEGPWQHVDIDFCGPFPPGDYLLVAIDEYSRFPEVEITRSTSAYSTIPKLDKIFSTYGIPEVVKSDNGPPYQSSEFKSFPEYTGFQRRKITPKWPQANSEVERFMRTLEKAIRCAILEGKVWKQEMYRFLRSYRATPHSSTGVSPATALFNRNIKTTLPENKEASKSDRTMRDADAIAKSRVKQYADKRAKAKSSNLQPGDIVMMKQKRTNKYSTPHQPMAYEVVARKGPMITARNERQVVTRNISRFKPVNVKMEPPMESDSMEDHSVNDDVPTEESEAEDTATPNTVERPSRTPPARGHSGCVDLLAMVFLKPPPNIEVLGPPPKPPWLEYTYIWNGTRCQCMPVPAPPVSSLLVLVSSMPIDILAQSRSGSRKPRKKRILRSLISSESFDMRPFSSLSLTCSRVYSAPSPVF
ncbi:hypothetical protein LSAT2_004428 [Lamellibrachia satsuma]|nr:hypothetical protein LSAT2_004428 [Lamellibrachia satsuma]